MTHSTSENFSIFSSMSTPVNNSKKYVRSSSYISTYLLWQLSKTSSIVFYNFECENRDNHPTFVFHIFSYSFCVFVVSIRNVFHCQISGKLSKLFFVWQWRIIKSAPAIHILIWISTFLRHQKNSVYVSITNPVCVTRFLVNPHQNLSHNFCYSLNMWIPMSYDWLLRIQGVL